MDVSEGVASLGVCPITIQSTGVDKSSFKRRELHQSAGSVLLQIIIMETAGTHRGHCHRG